MSTAHVICCNDAVMAVFLGTEADADLALEARAEADYAKDPNHWRDEAKRYGSKKDLDPYKYYRQCLHWHVRCVRVV